MWEFFTGCTLFSCFNNNPRHLSDLSVERWILAPSTDLLSDRNIWRKLLTLSDIKVKKLQPVTSSARKNQKSKNQKSKSKKKKKRVSNLRVFNAANAATTWTLSETTCWGSACCNLQYKEFTEGQLCFFLLSSYYTSFLTVLQIHYFKYHILHKSCSSKETG